MSTKSLIKFGVAFLVLAIALIFLGVNFVPRIKAFSISKETTNFAMLRDISAARWQALGDYYAKQSSLVIISDASLRAISAARWQALGDYYLKYYASIRDVSTARWQALGDYYSKQSAQALISDASLRDISAARWQALGEYYLSVAH